MALAASLLASPKDRAENLMIVDLLRNDIGRSCQPGSVRVPELFALESYPNVHHLVSSVTGELAPGKRRPRPAGRQLPGGSITGAPKIRAMQIIDELEPSRRGIYCGSLFYLDVRGEMDSLDRHPHPAGQERPGQLLGRRRHRRRLALGGRVPGNPGQGPGAAGNPGRDGRDSVPGIEELAFRGLFHRRRGYRLSERLEALRNSRLRSS